MRCSLPVSRARSAKAGGEITTSDLPSRLQTIARVGRSLPRSASTSFLSQPSDRTRSAAASPIALKGTTTACAPWPFSRKNASFFPSGENAGLVSLPSPRVSAAPEAVAGATSLTEIRKSPWPPVAGRAQNANFRPSGEKAGQLRDCDGSASTVRFSADPRFETSLSARLTSPPTAQSPSSKSTAGRLKKVALAIGFSMASWSCHGSSPPFGRPSVCRAGKTPCPNRSYYPRPFFCILPKS